MYKYVIILLDNNMPIRKFNQEISEFASTFKSYLATTRFNNQTWKENQDYLNHAHDTGEVSSKIKCLYSCNSIISESIPYQSNVFILEMNNETNKIIGIGLIKNCTPEYRKHKVYQKDAYNQFVYKGGYHINCNELNDTEKKVIDALEILCFKGKRHQKRMSGIKLFPLDILYDYANKADEEKRHNFVAEISSMFKTRFI